MSSPPSTPIASARSRANSEHTHESEFHDSKEMLSQQNTPVRPTRQSPPQTSPHSNVSLVSSNTASPTASLNASPPQRTLPPPAFFNSPPPPPAHLPCGSQYQNYLLRALLSHYNSGEAYNGILVLPLRKFQAMAAMIGYIVETGRKHGTQEEKKVTAVTGVNKWAAIVRSNKNVHKATRGSAANLHAATIGQVTVAYQSALTHIQPSFDGHGVMRGKKISLGEMEGALWRPLETEERHKERAERLRGEASCIRDVSKRQEFLKKKRTEQHLRGGGGAIASEKMLRPAQFRAALVELASNHYAAMITKCIGGSRSLHHLRDSEKTAAQEAAFTVFFEKKLKPFITKNCLLDKTHFDNVTAILCRPAVMQMYAREVSPCASDATHMCERACTGGVVQFPPPSQLIFTHRPTYPPPPSQLSALTTMFDHYSESERAKKMWDHQKHGIVGQGGVANRANLTNMSYKELITLLTDFGGIPYFITAKQVRRSALRERPALTAVRNELQRLSPLFSPSFRSCRCFTSGGCSTCGRWRRSGRRRRRRRS